jgi:N-acyl-L-homoserine lactone synthetase
MRTQTSFSSITYEVAQSEAMIRAAKNLCHDVYLQAGYIDQPLSGRIIPYEYDSVATYIVALNEAREVIGTIRLSQGPPFKTLEVWKDKLYPVCVPLINDALRGNSFEIGALAVRKDCCAMKISWGLYKAAYRCALALHLDYAIISMDARALRSLEMLGWFVVKIGEPMDYFGSLTVPGILPISKQAAAVQSKNLVYQKVLAA